MVAFPRKTIEWKAQEQPPLRRLSLALPWYGIAAGVVSHLYRWLVLALFAPRSIGMIFVSLGIGVAIMCALATGHLANFPLRHWKWRAPALGAFIALGECATSLVLTLVHQERLGKDIATLGEWPTGVVTIVWTRVLVICAFALVLAGVVATLQRTTSGKTEGVEE